MLTQYQRRINALAVFEPELVADIRTLLARLELVSHVSGRSYDGANVHGAAGTREPTGGDGEYAKGDERDALNESIYVRTIDYYRGQLAQAGAGDLKRIRDDIEATVGAWNRQAAPPDEPTYDNPQFKRWVAESPLSSKEIAWKYNVTTRYVNAIRQAYREANAL